jgi:type IV secretion system protein VirB4
MFRFSNPKPNKAAYSQKEVNASNFIPYKCHWNRNTILTKNNELMQVIKIGGFSFETADDVDLEIKKNMRNLLIKNMTSGNIILYFHTIRKKKPLNSATNKRSLKSVDITDFSEYLKFMWEDKHSSAKAFFNETRL